MQAAKAVAHHQIATFIAIGPFLADNHISGVPIDFKSSTNVSIYHALYPSPLELYLHHF